MDILKLLELYREEENPDLSESMCEGDNVTTLAKDEIINRMTSLNVDVLKTCRLGLIDPARENLCKLLHFAMLINNKEKTTDITVDPDEPGDGQLRPAPAKKPRKEGATVRLIFVLLCMLVF